jgi:hypothetical protein
LAGLACFAKLDKNRVRGLGVGKQALERVANSGRVADFGKGLSEFGVNADAARAFMQKLESELAARGRDAGRTARNTSLRSGTVLVYFLIVSQ